MLKYSLSCMKTGEHVSARAHICTPGVDFINVLRAVFAHEDPISVKRYRGFA